MRLCAVAAMLALALAALMAGAQGSDNKVDPLVARGRYLVAFGSCNDCHTPGWRESDGSVPVAQWMTGSNLGYRGPWGTSYPANVRLEFQRISEAEWLFMVRTRGGHWPMVWHDLRMLDDNDRRAIYRFVKSLGARGTQAPANLPPSREPATPFIWIVPH
jgi:mono/diheme cytochrome c family protein